jgi:hypothetical protein
MNDEIKPYTKTETTESSIVEFPLEKKKPQLRLMKGGNEPPAYNKDWLSDLRVGTEFLCRDKMGVVAPRWIVIEWIMGGLHPTGNVLLIPAKSPNDTKGWQWVDPREFCKFFEYRGIIEEPSDETYSNNPGMEPNS